MSETIRKPAPRFIRLPTKALQMRFARTPGRLEQFVRLVALTPGVAGIYDVRGRPVRLKAGQIVVSHGDLAKLWGVNRDTARRSLDAFEEEGLITVGDARKVEEIRVYDDPVHGSLVTVIGLDRDDPRESLTPPARSANLTPSTAEMRL